MKVAINGRFLQSRLEGIGRYTLELVDHMTQRHPQHEWHIILDRRYDHELFSRENLIIHILYPSARHPLLWQYWFEYRIPRLLSKIGADVFFSPDGYLSLRTEVPTVLTIHDLAYAVRPSDLRKSHLRYMQKYLPQYLEKATSIVAISDFTKASIAKYQPEVSHKVSRIYNGVSDSFRPISDKDKIATRTRWTGGRPYFLYIGAIHPRKNVARLVKAFLRYKEQSNDPSVLLIVGRYGWLSKDIEQQIKAGISTGDVIHIKESIEDIETLVGGAICMCYISLLEGFGLPVLEAMACGVPVLTSIDSSMAEVAGPMVTYVDPYDISSSQKALLTAHAAKFNWAQTALEVFEKIENAASFS